MESDFVPTKICNDKGTTLRGLLIFDSKQKMASKMRARGWDMTSKIFMGPLVLEVMPQFLALI